MLAVLIVGCQGGGKAVSRLYGAEKSDAYIMPPDRVAPLPYEVLSEYQELYDKAYELRMIAFEFREKANFLFAFADNLDNLATRLEQSSISLTGGVVAGQMQEPGFTDIPETGYDAYLPVIVQETLGNDEQFYPNANLRKAEISKLKIISQEIRADARDMEEKAKWYDQYAVEVESISHTVKNK